LTKCGDLSAVEAEETETAVVAVKTAETAEALETAAVTLTTVVLTIKAAAMLVMTTAVAVYRRGHWFVSNVSDVRTMWNITLCVFEVLQIHVEMLLESYQRAGPSLLNQSDLSCLTSFMLVFFSWMPI
jgi:hypothetical protein